MANQLSGQEGRPGKRGQPVLIVLNLSVGLMLAALAGQMMWQGGNSDSDYAKQSQDASRKQVTGSESGSSNTPSSTNSAMVPSAKPVYPQPSKPSAN
ncbi:hypothetical protein [Methylobacterium gregans]|uniref:Uncharacterized protein n=1 Tax=Methylobacterium gregans TaxID=374424 RepID=A0AA37HRW3_9HYPH|nr:hypothetical protein [Methylobacterium gregans]MDQ0518817.1 flagellar basal body-associated protein FliL [Methylobacterium gregans]GJD80495.1 hypothetical protein NBEOAGPD_3736 [Methylobacterium gregans]GLS56423.1 hypothetical protein GCM10007886_46080 [Methylobacterium gregans]